jgi:hypothetical protein
MFLLLVPKEGATGITLTCLLKAEMAEPEKIAITSHC